MVVLKFDGGVVMLDLDFKMAEERYEVLSQSQKEFMDNTTILMYGGMSYGVKTLAFPQKFFLLKRTKLLQSKSKQSRIVSVACK